MHVAKLPMFMAGLLLPGPMLPLQVLVLHRKLVLVNRSHTRTEERLELLPQPTCRGVT